MAIIIFILRSLFILAVIGFAALNAQVVTLDMYFLAISAPLAQLILLAMLVGYLLRFIFPWLFFWKKRRSFLHDH